MEKAVQEGRCTLRWCGLERRIGAIHNVPCVLPRGEHQMAKAFAYKEGSQSVEAM